MAIIAEGRRLIDGKADINAKFAEIPSVKDFGAAGNGTTDDTTAFLNAASANSHLLVPPGTYILDNLAIPSNTIFEGVGPDSILRLKTSSSTLQVMNVGASITDVTLKNLQVDVNGLANSVGILASGKDVSALNCLWVGGGTSAVYGSGAFERILIQGNHFKQSGRGFLTESSATGNTVTITGNFFDRCTRDGVMLNTPTGSAYGFTVSDNHFYKTANADVSNTGMAVGSDGADEVIITGNRFEYSLYQDVHIEDAVNRAVITDNISKWAGVARDSITMSRVALDAIHLVTATAASTDIIVRGNQVFEPARHGIYAAPSGLSIRNVQVDGNHVDRAGAEGIIVGSLARRGILANNIVTDSVGAGISIAGPNAADYQWIVDGNQSYDAGRGTQTYGFSYASTRQVFLGLNHFSGTIAAMNDGGSNTETRNLLLDPPNKAFLPTGAKYSTISRELVSSSTGATVSGRLHLAAIELPAGFKVTNISFLLGGTVPGTPTNQWFSLWDVNRAKLGVTTDDTTTAWTAGTIKTLALTTPYTIPSDGLYYLGIVVVASTAPTLSCHVPGNYATGLAPVLTGSSTTGLTNPASAPATAGAMTGINVYPFAYVS